MTKDEWINRFKHQLGGLAIFGMISDQKDGALARTRHVWEVRDTVLSLSGEMWDAATNETATELCDRLIAKLKTATEGERNMVIEKMRAALTKEKK